MIAVGSRLGLEPIACGLFGAVLSVAWGFWINRLREKINSTLTPFILLEQQRLHQPLTKTVDFHELLNQIVLESSRAPLVGLPYAARE